jgi:hypothetical protein
VSGLRVYVSGPLSGPNAEENVEVAMKVGRTLIEKGYFPLVPHLTWYMDPDNELGHETWLDIDKAWITVADVVVRLPGPSKGADIEVAHAMRIGVPVFYSLDDLLRCDEAGMLLPVPAFSAALVAP